MKYVLGFALLLALILPIPLPGQDGSYNMISRWYWCSNETACLHEIGHKLDQDAGWISHSKEFGQAVQTYVITELHKEQPSLWADRIVTFPGIYTGYQESFFSWTQSELYASMFAWSGGHEQNMPEIFRPFYDWQRAADLLERSTWQR